MRGVQRGVVDVESEPHYGRWEAGRRQEQRKDPKGTIHEINPLTLLVTEAYDLIHPALERTRYDLVRCAGEECG